MITNLSAEHSLVSNWVKELRSVDIQKDRMRFRRNLERIGEVAAYEISKELPSVVESVKTPLGSADCKVLEKQPVISTILRAGLPMHQGVLNYFDQADNAFISAYRKHTEDGFEIKVEYLSSPSIEGRPLIVADPMIATGSSLVSAVKALYDLGTPSHIYIVCAIAAKEGLEFVEKELGTDISIWCGVIDNVLNADSYIVPGLGDAGDLAYGEKAQH